MEYFDAIYVSSMLVASIPSDQHYRYLCFSALCGIVHSWLIKHFCLGTRIPSLGLTLCNRCYAIWDRNNGNVRRESFIFAIITPAHNAEFLTLTSSLFHYSFSCWFNVWTVNAEFGLKTISNNCFVITIMSIRCVLTCHRGSFRCRAKKCVKNKRAHALDMKGVQRSCFCPLRQQF